MWEGSYGKEPFDLRLTVLRLCKRWKSIVIFTLLGTLFFGGLYCVKNILFRGEKQYSAESTYRVDYGVEDVDVGLVVINASTWDTYVHTEEFLNCVRGYLSGAGLEQMSNEALGAYIRADLASDWRVPSTKVITESPEKSRQIAQAVEETMTTDFPEGISEVKSIRVIDHALEGREVIPDIRVGRAFLLAAVVSCFFTFVVLLLKEIGDDSIWLPATISHRYGLKTVGTLESKELAENISYFFGGMKSVAVCALQEEINPVEVAEALRKVQEENRENELQWQPVPTPILCPESVTFLRKAEGVLLAVKAGEHTGKKLEYVLDFLGQQDCKITAVILWNADEKLIGQYYWKGKESRRGK